MKKIISLFQRDYSSKNRLVFNEAVPGAEWVLAGEGVATRKWDGTCCLVKDAKLYKRYDAKHGKTPPDGFISAQEPDPITGHWPGWLLIGEGPEDQYFRSVFSTAVADGTYELCGPKVNGNPEGFDRHVLIKHGDEILEAPRTFDELKEYFANADIEGIVWHHEDGRMVKIKGKDFGIMRPNSTRKGERK